MPNIYTSKRCYSDPNTQVDAVLDSPAQELVGIHVDHEDTGGIAPIGTTHANIPPQDPQPPVAQSDPVDAVRVTVPPEEHSLPAIPRAPMVQRSLIVKTENNEDDHYPQAGTSREDRALCPPSSSPGSGAPSRRIRPRELDLRAHPYRGHRTKLVKLEATPQAIQHVEDDRLSPIPEVRAHQVEVRAKYPRKARKFPDTDGVCDDPYLYWYKSVGSERLAFPPNFMYHPEKEIGDVFYHCWGPTRKDCQFWWWKGDAEGWEEIYYGFARPVDGRVLMVSKNKMLPSWAKGSWADRNQISK
ncbi:hypothetical protein EUX98_g8709 [Antrodiella citrinella]|uniref:Uncharacterized protein n=1 Tax=Antrodiella citrinella TaxID=2447956 RepID=A0A4S4M9X8_9APHY|nr:hypothetical protein EUX98_g8709 [Antrodiella citrinella]